MKLKSVNRIKLIFSNINKLTFKILYKVNNALVFQRCFFFFLVFCVFVLGFEENICFNVDTNNGL